METKDKLKVDKFISLIKGVMSSNLIALDRNVYYAETYDSMIKFFSMNKEVFDKDTFYQGLNMIYGWMPTIPKNSKPVNDDSICIELLKKAYYHKPNTTFTKKDYQELIPYVNNSIVGLSKMLHFINPNVYPIWDSNIAYIFGLKWNYQVNNVRLYMIYMIAMHNVGSENGSLREIELKLFESGQFARKIERQSKLK